MCTFEKDESSCLLTNEYTNEDEVEMWNIVHGPGVVADNTLGSGLSVYGHDVFLVAKMFKVCEIPRNLRYSVLVAD